MSGDKALIAWEHWRESSEKLDYFILGTSSALTAYIGQHRPKAILGFNAGSSEVASVVVLALSVVAGVGRHRARVASLGAQQYLHDAMSIAGQMRTMLQTGGGRPLIDRNSGRTYTAAEATQRIEREDKRIAAARARSERWKRRAERAYNWRDWLLVAGVLFYAAAKVWTVLPAR
jgi:hypothetical protein